MNHQISFLLAENAQWVYRVKSTDTENGEISGYEEGITYLVVTEIDLQYENIDFIHLRVTGKQYYNKSPCWVNTFILVMPQAVH